MIDVKLTGGTPVSNLERFKWLKMATTWADEVGPIGRTLMRYEAPISKGPNAGQLRRKIRYERRTSAGSVKLMYGVSVPYAKWVVSGTRPHVIRPVAARALRFQGQGGTVFARAVRHPGTRANDFPARAMTRFIPVAQGRLTTIMRELGG